MIKSGYISSTCAQLTYFNNALIEVVSKYQSRLWFPAYDFCIIEERPIPQMNYTTKASMFRVKGIKPQSICIATRQGSVCSSKFHNTHRLKYRAKSSKHTLQTDNRLLPNRSLNATKQHQGHTKKNTLFSWANAQLGVHFLWLYLATDFLQNRYLLSMSHSSTELLESRQGKFSRRKKNEKTDKYLYRCFLFFFLSKIFRHFEFMPKRYSLAKNSAPHFILVHMSSHFYALWCLIFFMLDCLEIPKPSLASIWVDLSKPAMMMMVFGCASMWGKMVKVREVKPK